MKRNWIVIALLAIVTVAAWAQTATTPAPQADTKACACCNHDAKAGADSKAGCCGKDAKACMRKGAKGCCEGMKHDAKVTTASAKSTDGCCGKECKDCCKDGKCTMAKNGKKCCDHCQNTAEGK